MHPVDHLLELGDHARAPREEARIGGEEADRVVAPVVGEAMVGEMAVVDERVNRHQFDGGHAEALDMFDDFLLPEALERAAHVLRHGRMALRVAAHVGFVEDRVVPWHACARRVRPGEALVDDLALLHERCAVALVEGEIVAVGVERVAEHGRVPLQLADVRLRVRIEQQLVRIEAMARFRFVGAMHAIAVYRAGPQAEHVDVPDFIGVFRQFDAFEFPLA